MAAPLYGQALSFTAAVAVINLGAGSPTGTVQFEIDGSDFGAPVGLVGGSATSPAIATLTAGDHTVTAVYSGDSSFATSTSTNLSLAVSKAHLTVVADDKGKVYGAPMPELTASYAGFVNGDDATKLGGTLGFDTAATQSSHVVAGGYPVTPRGLSSGNYAITFSPGTLTVTPAPLSIAVSDSQRTYGDPNPSFSASYRGFVNGDDASRLKGSLAYSTAAAASSSVGPYAVSVGGQTSSDYAIESSRAR
jgi:hypothetical protein